MRPTLQQRSAMTGLGTLCQGKLFSSRAMSDVGAFEDLFPLVVNQHSPCPPKKKRERERERERERWAKKMVRKQKSRDMSFFKPPTVLRAMGIDFKGWSAFY